MGADESEERQFAMAIKRGDLEAVRAGLEAGWPANGWDDGVNWTPLRYTAEHQQAGIAKLLLEHGADPNHPECDGYSALEHSVSAVIDFGTDGARVTWEHVDVLLTAGAEMTPRARDDIRRGGPKAENSFRDRGAPYPELDLT